MLWRDAVGLKESNVLERLRIKIDLPNLGKFQEPNIVRPHGKG